MNPTKCGQAASASPSTAPSSNGSAASPSTGASSPTRSPPARPTPAPSPPPASSPPTNSHQTLEGLDRVGERALNWAHRISATSGQIDYETSNEQIGAAIVASAPQAEDIHHFVELELTKEIGTLALKLHTGRSRNEQIATDMRLFVRDAIDTTKHGLHDWLNALLTLAEQHTHPEATIMPGYTHLQRAEPVLLAHWLLAYVAMLERDLSRFHAAQRTHELLPPRQRSHRRRHTQTRPLHRQQRPQLHRAHTSTRMDATSDRDFMLDFAQAASTLGLHISRFAEELTLYATAEFNFVDLPEAFSTGSSAMPQKKNPDLTELARGKAARLLGSSTALSTLIKGLPLAYNKDLQEGQEQTFDIADTLAGLLSASSPTSPEPSSSAPPNSPKPPPTATSTPWPPPPTFATKASPSAKPTRSSATPSAWQWEMGASTPNASSTTSPSTSSATYPQPSNQISSWPSTPQATLDCHDVPGGTARHPVAEALAAARQKFKDAGQPAQEHP